jgi:hypothetical protein
MMCDNKSTEEIVNPEDIDIWKKENKYRTYTEEVGKHLLEKSGHLNHAIS